MRLVAVIHRPGRAGGLTQEVESLLRCSPARWWTLGDVMSCVRANALKGEVASVLHKGWAVKRVLLRRRVLGEDRRGHLRLMSAFRWSAGEEKSWSVD